MIFLTGCSFTYKDKEVESEPEFEELYESIDKEDSSDSPDFAAEEDSMFSSDSSDKPSTGASSTEGSSTEDSSAEGSSTESSGGLLSGPLDINLRDTDGNGKNYLFTYDGEDYSAVYTKENWKIYDSYKISNTEDITIICEALISVHPIHGSDMQSYRTAEDMAYEWLQHNIAYQFLADDSPWKEHTRDVDLDPKDQGKSFADMYEDRTGKEFNLKDFLKTP